MQQQQKQQRQQQLEATSPPPQSSSRRRAGSSRAKPPNLDRSGEHSCVLSVQTLLCRNSPVLFSTCSFDSGLPGMESFDGKSPSVKLLPAVRWSYVALSACRFCCRLPLGGVWRCRSERTSPVWHHLDPTPHNQRRHPKNTSTALQRFFYFIQILK